MHAGNGAAAAEEIILPDPRTLYDHKGRVDDWILTADSQRVVLVSADSSLRIWNLASGVREPQSVYLYHGHLWMVDSQRVISGSGYQREMLTVQNRSSGAREHTLSGHTSSVTDVSLTADGQRVISASKDKTLRVWNLASGKCEQTLSGHKGAVTACTVIPDSQRVISASDDYTVKVWNRASGVCEQTLSGFNDQLLRASVITADGQQMVSAWGHTLRVWNLSSGVCERILIGHTRRVTTCALTSDGQRVVSASSDKTVKVWDFASGICEHTLGDYTEGVIDCKLTPDGRWFVSTYDDQTVKIRDLGAFILFGQASSLYREDFKNTLSRGKVYARSVLFKYDLNAIPFSPLPAIFAQADQQNNASAQAQLGYHYWLGIGLPKDLELARYWYTQSSRQGNVAATAWLAAHPA